MTTKVLDLFEQWRGAGAPLPPVGSSRGEALRRARFLLEEFVNPKDAAFAVNTDFDKECLYAVVETALHEIDVHDSRGPRDRVVASRILNAARWPQDNMGELEDLRERLSIMSEDGRKTAEHILAIPIHERAQLNPHLRFSDPEMLLALRSILDFQIESAPRKTRDEARWAYETLFNEPCHFFPLDVRDHYLGELSLLAGTAARFLGDQDGARTWFNRSETWFLLTVNPTIGILRIACQRLMVKVEQREFDEVIVLAGPLRETFLRAGDREHALKCRYLEAVCLKEMDRLAQSLEIFEAVVEEAKAIGSERILSPALVSIIQIHSELGDTDKAFALTLAAAPVLRESKNRVSLAKLQWGLANLLRQTGRLAESIGAFRSAQHEFQEIGLRGDVAAVHLILADLLLETDQERQAEWEIRAALPIIDELKMVPEGFAAMSLLRESLRRRSIDRQALRSLHGYFEELSS